jgi:hypothetical protein
VATVAAEYQDAVQIVHVENVVGRVVPGTEMEEVYIRSYPQKIVVVPHVADQTVLEGTCDVFWEERVVEGVWRQVEVVGQYVDLPIIGLPPLLDSSISSPV